MKFNFKCLFILLFVNTVVFAEDGIDYQKRLISQNFNSSIDAYNSAMQGTGILNDDASNLFTNPSASKNIENFIVGFNSSNFFSGFYSGEQLLFVMAKDSVSRLGASVTWMNYGEYYDTQKLPVGGIYDETGNATGDSVGYWDDDSVVIRDANDFLINFTYGRNLRKGFYVGAKLNALISSYELSTNFGASLDVSGIYEKKSVLFTVVLSNLGAGVIGNADSDELDYEYMHLKLGARYRKNIRGRADSYLDLLVSHNALFLDNADLSVGVNLRIKQVFDIYGSYNLRGQISDELKDYNRFGVGAGLNFKYLEIKYSHVIDTYNSVCGNLSLVTRF